MPDRKPANHAARARFGLIPIAQAIFVVAGSIVAAYLVWVHYQQDALVCGLGDCEKVQTSSYAEFAGIPIAWFGLALYLAIAALYVTRRLGTVAEDIAAILVVGASFAGTLAVAWLTYLELWVIHAICQWCVAFAIVTVLLFVVSVLDLRVVLSTPIDHPDQPESS